MARAGTAYIQFRGDFSELQRDIKRATAQMQKLSSEEGEVKLEADTSDFQRNLKAAERDLRRFGARSAEATAEIKQTGDHFQLASQHVATFQKSILSANSRFQLFRNTLNLIKWPALITGLGAAAQGMSALAAGATGLVGALAPLSGALAAYPALLGAIGQAAGVVALAGIKDLTEAMAGNEEAMKRLSPAAKRFMVTLKGFEKQFRSLQGVAQKGLFTGVEQGVRSAMSSFGALRRVVRVTANTMGDLTARFGEFVGRQGFARDFEKVGRTNARLLDQLGRSALHFADALRHVSVVAQPLIRFLGRSVLELSRWTEEQAKAGRESGRMADFFDQTRAVINRLVSIGTSLASVFREIGQAAAPLGRQILRELDAGADALERWAESTRGRNSLEKYFADAKPAIFEAGRLIRDATQGFFELGNTPGLANLIRQFRTELLPVLVDMTRQTTKAFGPRLIEFLVQFGKLMSNFVGTSGPLTLLVRGMTQFLRLLNGLFQASPALRNATVSFVAIGAALKTLQFAKAITGFNMIRDAILRLGETRIGQAVVERVGTALDTLLSTVRVKTEKLKGRFRLMGTGLGRALGAGVAAGIVIGLVAFGPQIEKKINEILPDDFDIHGTDFFQRGQEIAEAIMRGVASTLRGLPGLIVEFFRRAWQQALQEGREFRRAAARIGEALLDGLREPLRAIGRLFEKAWDTARDATSDSVRPIRQAARTIGDAVSNTAGDAFRSIANVVKRAMDKVVSVFRPAAKVVGKVARGMARAIRSSVEGIREVFRGLANVLKKVAGFIAKTVNKIIAALGKLKDKIPDITPSLPSLPSIPDIPSPPGFQTGGMMVPGRGSGDKVHMQAMVEPGEQIFVLNRNASARLRWLKELNQRIGRFQSGGRLPHFQTGGLQPGASDLARTMVGRFGGQITSGLRPGDPGFHGRGMAIDWSGGDWTAGSRYSNAIGPQLLEGIHNAPPGLDVSWDSRHKVSPSFWGSGTWADHVDHIHLAVDRIIRGGAKYAGVAVPLIKEFMIKGKGRVADIARAAAEKMRSVANNYLGGLGGSTAGVDASGPLQAIAQRLVVARWGQGQWPPFDELVERESGWDPTAVNASSGAAGLAQALPPSKYPPSAWPYKGKESAVKQLQWMINYISGRYGTPSSAIQFHNAHNWYRRGGVVGRRRGGLLPRLATGGVPSPTGGSGLLSQNYVPIPGFQIRGKRGYFIPPELRRIKRDVKGAREKLLSIIEGQINADSEFGYGLPPDSDRAFSTVQRSADYAAEAAGIAAGLTKEVPIPATKTTEEGIRTILGIFNAGGKGTEGYWLQQQINHLLTLQLLLNNADTFIADMARQIGEMIAYSKAMLRIRENLIKKLERWLKRLKSALSKAEDSDHKKRIQKRIDFVNTEIKKEKKVVSALKSGVIPGLETEKTEATEASANIGAGKIDLVGLTGAGGQLGDVRTSLASFREMAKALVVPGAKIEGLEEEGEADSQMAELLKQLLEEERKRNLVLEAQIPVFEGFFGNFQGGGVVPGPSGVVRPILAHGNEVVLTPEQAAAMGGTHVTVVVEDGAVDPDKISTVVSTHLRDEQSRARRMAGGRV